MASWNEKREGEELECCPVCFVQISKKRRTYHVSKCYETYEGTLDERGLIRCPLHPLHIMPKPYLNHHLETNCDGASNRLRKFFQLEELQSEFKEPPPEFLANVPEDLLNKHNKVMLYLCRVDLKGNDISNDKFLYPGANT